MTITLRQTDPRAIQVVGASVVLVVAMSIAAWVAWPVLVALAVVALGVTAYAAHRWPLVTLVVSTLAVLADEVLIPSVLPDTISLGPIGVSEPMIAVTGIVIAVNAYRRGVFWSALRDPVLVLLAAFMAVAILSAVVNATPPAVAALGIFMTVDAMAAYFIARMAPSGPRPIAMAIGAVVGVAGLASLVGILQMVLHPDLLGFASFAGRFGEGGRITSFLGNPNMVAAVVGFVMPFPLYAARHLPRQSHRRWAFAVLVGFTLTLLLTFSRGAWLAVFLGVLLGLLVLDRRGLLTLVAAIVVAWLITIVMPRNLLISEEDLALFYPGRAETPNIIDSTVNRFDEVYERRDLRMRFIRDGIPIVLDNMALGVGPGQYGGAASVIIPSPVYAEYGTELYGFRTVHNFWLHLLGEVGVVGTTTFLAMIVGLWLRLVRAARHESDPITFVLLAGTGTAIGVVSLNNVTEMVFEGNFPGTVIWMAVGLVSVLAPPAAIFGRHGAEPSD